MSKTTDRERELLAIAYQGTLTTVMTCLIANNVHTAVKIISPKLVLRTTRVKHKRGGYAKDRLNFQVHVGKPNYREREYIKQLLKAKEPFPVQKVKMYGRPK